MSLNRFPKPKRSMSVAFTGDKGQLKQDMTMLYQHNLGFSLHFLFYLERLHNHEQIRTILKQRVSFPKYLALRQLRLLQIYLVVPLYFYIYFSEVHCSVVTFIRHNTHHRNVD